MSLYKIESCSGASLAEVTEQANKLIDEWSRWDTKKDLGVNPVTGEYYFVLTIYKD